MNKFLQSVVVCAAALAILPAAAQGDDRPDYIYVPEVIVSDDGKATVEVWLNTYVEQYNTFVMDIYLPEGFTIDKDRRGNYAFKPNTADDVLYDHTFSTKDYDDYVRIVALSMTKSYILPGNNMIFSFGITGPRTTTSGAQAGYASPSSPRTSTTPPSTTTLPTRRLPCTPSA